MSEQMTLREVLRVVATAVPADAFVKFDTGRYFFSPHAYRGDHEQLAISGRKDVPMTAEEALVRLGSIIGEEIGESQIVMDFNTPVWHSSYGEVDSLAIVGYKISKKGNLVFKTKYVDWL